MELRQLVPQAVNGWRAQAGGQVYDRTTLFDYIDGGAELYLAYSFREMLACRFHREGHPDIVVDLFDMDSSEDAFGVLPPSEMTLTRASVRARSTVQGC